MDRKRRLVGKLLSEVEAALDWARYHVHGARGRGPYRIVAYRGHGTRDTLYLKGRVLAGEPIPAASEHDSAWRNLIHTLRRLESDEVPAARVRARVGDRSWEALADDEGYFELRLDVAPALGVVEAWRAVELELVDPPGEGVTTGYVLVPAEEARFGVISDIDDTVVKTDVTNLLSMLRLVLLTNAHTRLPFEGVAAFYRALHAGAAGERTNPIFYVSSSPWSLFELLQEVFEVHGIPLGPIFLRDFGLSREMLFSTTHREHKLAAIEQILTSHPHLPFILMGDSGQHDPEIYCEAAQRHPGRIHTVYIRDVTGERRDAEVRDVARRLREMGVEIVFTTDTVGAALHAAAHGFIDPDTLGEIRGEQARDQAAPGPIESVVRRSPAEPPV